jgi:hypothetical protein
MYEFMRGRTQAYTYTPAHPSLHPPLHRSHTYTTRPIPDLKSPHAPSQVMPTANVVVLVILPVDCSCWLLALIGLLMGAAAVLCVDDGPARHTRLSPACACFNKSWHKHCPGQYKCTSERRVEQSCHGKGRVRRPTGIDFRSCRARRDRRQHTKILSERSATHHPKKGEESEACRSLVCHAHERRDGHLESLVSLQTSNTGSRAAPAATTDSRGGDRPKKPGVVSSGWLAASSSLTSIWRPGLLSLSRSGLRGRPFFCCRTHRLGKYVYARGVRRAGRSPKRSVL